VTKPCSAREVVLRVQAILHRSQHGTSRGGPAIFGHGRLYIDDDRHEVSRDGQLIELTPTEWGILTALAAAPGRVHSRYELVNRVRGYEFDGYERTIDTHVKNLRHKLGDPGPEIVETVMGAGYRLGWSRDE
jgi:DNA-binding response OmpR family regulator